MSSTNNYNTYSTHHGTALVPVSHDEQKLLEISKVAETLTTMSSTCISLAKIVEQKKAAYQGMAREVELFKTLNEEGEKHLVQATLEMHGEYRRLDVEANMRMDKLDARASALADAERELSQRKRKLAQDEEILKRDREALEALEAGVRAAKQAREDEVADVTIADAEVVSVCVDASTNTTEVIDIVDNSVLPIAPSVVAGPPPDAAVAPAAAPLVVGAVPVPVSFASGDLVLVSFGKNCVAVQKFVHKDSNNMFVDSVTKLNLPSEMGSKVSPDAVQHITPDNAFGVCDLVLSKKNITKLYTRYKRFVEAMHTTTYSGYGKLEKNEFAQILTKDTLAVLKPLFSFPDGMRVPRNDTALVDLVTKLNKAPETEDEADDVEDEVEVEVDAEVEVKSEIA